MHKSRIFLKNPRHKAVSARRRTVGVQPFGPGRGRGRSTCLTDRIGLEPLFAALRMTTLHDIGEYPSIKHYREGKTAASEKVPSPCVAEPNFRRGLEVARQTFVRRATALKGGQRKRRRILRRRRHRGLPRSAHLWEAIGVIFLMATDALRTLSTAEHTMPYEPFPITSRWL